MESLSRGEKSPVIRAWTQNIKVQMIKKMPTRKILQKKKWLSLDKIGIFEMKRRKGRSWLGIGIGQNEIFEKGCLCGEEEETVKPIFIILLEVITRRSVEVVERFLSYLHRNWNCEGRHAQWVSEKLRREP